MTLTEVQKLSSCDNSTSYVNSRSLANFGQKSLWDFNALQLLSFSSMVPINLLILDLNVYQIKPPIPSYHSAILNFKKRWNWNVYFNFKSYIVLTHFVCAPALESTAQNACTWSHPRGHSSAEVYVPLKTTRRWTDDVFMHSVYGPTDWYRSSAHCAAVGTELATVTNFKIIYSFIGLGCIQPRRQILVRTWRIWLHSTAVNEDSKSDWNVFSTGVLQSSFA